MPRDSAAEDKTAPPEPHVVSAALRKRLQQCHEHGTKLMQQEACDHDYTHSILVECVLHDPGNLTYVETMLRNLQQKFGDRRRGASISGLFGRGPFKKAVARKDWAEVLKLGPPLLKSNPWDVTVLRGLAEACAAYGYHEAELRYLKNALDANPRNADVNRHCARSLARVGQYDQAISCWQRVDEIKKGDDEAQKMMSELQIEKTRQRGGLGGEGSRAAAKRPAPPPDDEADVPPPAEEAPRRREVKLTHRQQLEQQIANNPADTEAYLELVDLHLEADRYGEAVHVLHKALSATSNDVKIQERLEDVEILRKKHHLTVAEEQAGTAPSDERRQEVEQLRAELHQFEWEVFARRSERYPDDLELKFQLGIRLKKLDKFAEAIGCFRAARELPQRCAGAWLELGECWQRQKQYAKALDCYCQASERCQEDQIGLRKLALYRAGILASGLHNLESAETFLAQLAELDAGYKDVAARLDKIRGMRDKD
jgi:tetratricopeptide (TPR) repeat protein